MIKRYYCPNPHCYVVSFDLDTELVPDDEKLQEMRCPSCFTHFQGKDEEVAVSVSHKADPMQWSMGVAH